jgi:hypothetical protein
VPEATESHGPQPSRVHAQTVRWWWFVVTVLTYGLVLLWIDPGGQIGSDAAAKVSSLEHMRVHGSAIPEVSYWAQDHDPSGRLFPIYDATLVDGKWIPVTTLPMIEVMRPLYRVGGVRFALALPMAGALACAWAAAALAQRVRVDMRTAFFVVALASPVTVYAFAIWEHTIGLAGIAWGAVLLLDVGRGVRSWRWAILAGVLLGIAATMRTEALVYAAVLGATFGVVLAHRRRSIVPIVHVGVATLAGLQLPLLANSLLERAILGTDLRSGRVTSAASGSGAEPLVRLRDGAVGLFAVVADDNAASIGFGVVLAVAIGAAVLLARDVRTRRRAHQLLALAGVIMVLAFTGGLGFVPGLVPTTPIAAAAVVVWYRRDAASRALAIAAWASILVVWLTQYTSKVVPQWSGRYVIASGLFLTVLGVAALDSAFVRRALIGLAAGVTAFGLVWTAQRTHDVADFFAMVDATGDDVVISREAYLMREAGSRVVGRQWLRADTDEDLSFAFDVVRATDATSVLVIQRPGDREPAAPPCFERSGLTPVKFLRTVPFTFVSYRAVAGCSQ